MTITLETLPPLLSADVWRYAAAAVSVGVLFLLAVGVTFHGDRLPRPWRMVLWAVVLEQSVLAYLEVARAVSTPPGYPDRVDLPLVGITVSLLLLLAAIVGVFLLERPRPGTYRGRGDRKAATQ